MSKVGKNAAKRLHRASPQDARELAAELRNIVCMPLAIADELDEPDRGEMIDSVEEILELSNLLWGAEG